MASLRAADLRFVIRACKRLGTQARVVSDLENAILRREAEVKKVIEGNSLERAQQAHEALARAIRAAVAAAIDSVEQSEALRFLFPEEENFCIGPSRDRAEGLVRLLAEIIHGEESSDDEDGEAERCSLAEESSRLAVSNIASSKEFGRPTVCVAIALLCRARVHLDHKCGDDSMGVEMGMHTYVRKAFEEGVDICQVSENLFRSASAPGDFLQNFELLTDAELAQPDLETQI